MTDGAAEPQRPRATLDLAGRVLDGRYRVETLLGAGGMGSVYRARQITLEKVVAIKVLRPDYADRQDAVKRFLREARAASKIRHPNVVEVVDFGHSDDGLVYFVMEFLEGQDLARVVRKEAPLPWRRAKRILLQIARALKAAHAKGIVHRDVKPANCFLVRAADDEPDWVKVLDFGIAKVVAGDAEVTEGLTSTSQVMGTALYMAPEQAMGRTIDMRTDVYALGVMAFEMLTGKQPFTGATTFEVLMKRVSEPPPLLGAFRPELGPAVEALLQQAMARDPVARWQTMKDVEAALVQIDDALDDRTADRRAQTRPMAEAIEEAPPTATSARHKPAPAGITMPTEASPGRAGERLAELLEAGDPTEAGTRVEERSAGRTVVAAAEAVPAERKHGTTIAIAAAVAVLAVGGGAWWMLGRDDVGSREIAMGAEGSDASAKAARDELSRAANEADAEDEAAGADELVARPADDAEQRDDAGEGGGANADAHDAAEGGDADAAGDDAVQGGAADAARQEDGKADESAGRKASSRGRARASRREPTPTVALVIGKLRRKARARCNADGVEVGVEFLVQESGATAMVRGTSSNGDSRLADCVVAVVEGTRFPAGDPRSRSLKVSL